MHNGEEKEHHFPLGGAIELYSKMGQLLISKTFPSHLGI
jgi:hypothetical protein